MAQPMLMQQVQQQHPSRVFNNILIIFQPFLNKQAVKPTPTNAVVLETILKRCVHARG